MLGVLGARVTGGMGETWLLLIAELTLQPNPTHLGFWFCLCFCFLSQAISLYIT